MKMKHELQAIISGKGEVRYGAAIQAAADYLRRSIAPSNVVEKSKLYKKQEAKILEEYISDKNIWISDKEIKNYISEGAEQKVYLKDGKNVIKINDSIFYQSWDDYFKSLLLHNYFFPDTAYKLFGFFKNEGNLFSVVEQPYVIATEKTDLNNVKLFMEANGFKNIKNNDYLNQELGIILEDLHDENVLTENGVLQFIDTVFYLTENFYL